MSCISQLAPDLRLDGVLCSHKHIACGRRTGYVLRTRESEIHPSRVNALKHFFGRSGVALRDAELLERFRPPCTRGCKGFYVECQDITQLTGHLLYGRHFHDLTHIPVGFQLLYLLSSKVNSRDGPC